MSFNDPIAELLTKMRNAGMAKHRYVDIHLSKMKVSILKILKEKGFIANYLIDENKKKIRIFLKYSKNRNSVMKGLQRVSKPGLRKYVRYDEIPVVLGGMGISILSTSQGILDGNKARHDKIGGELLCYVW